MLAAQKEVELCYELLERLTQARGLTDQLFAILRPDSLYERPIPERHRIVFYVGHLEAFDWNLLRDRVLHLDGRNQLALVAQTCGDGVSTVIAEARYALVSDGLDCEFALSVADDSRQMGLGTQLLAEIECRARALGARRLVGDVLRSNETMQAFARKAGFTMTGVPADARLIRVVKDLATSSAASPCKPAISELPIAA